MKIVIPKAEPRAAEIQREADAVAAELLREPMVIATAEQALTVGDVLGQLRGQKKELTEMMGRATKPLNAALAEVRSWFQPAIKSIDTADRLLTQSLGVYRLAQAEAARAAQLEAAKAAEEGDLDALVVALDKETPATSDAATSTSFKWVVAHIDESKLPREYLCADTAKLKAYARATPGRDEITPIAGVTFKREAVVRRRA